MSSVDKFANILINILNVYNADEWDETPSGSVN